MSERRARFDRLYARDIDPWGFRTSGYEQEKYHATLAALPRSRYGVGVEAGCSIGELTRLLSSRCDYLVGIDVSSLGPDEALRRNADRPNIRFRRGELPGAWPDMPVDLVVLSEVLYFLSPLEIDALAGRLSQTWCDGGDCVLFNYLVPTAESLQGAEAADLFIEALKRRTSVQHPTGTTRGQYRLDVLIRPR